MARPPLDPDRKRVRKVEARVTEAEFEDLARKAAEAGVPLSAYVRETLLGRRPKARPLTERALQALVYELASLGANFTQLHERTGEVTYADWARYVAGDLPERCARYRDRAPMFVAHIEAINAAGQQLNRLARLANIGKPVDGAEMDRVLEALKDALAPIHNAVREKLTPDPEDPAPAKDETRAPDPDSAGRG